MRCNEDDLSLIEQYGIEDCKDVLEVVSAMVEAIEEVGCYECNPEAEADPESIIYATMFAIGLSSECARHIARVCKTVR